VAAGLGERAGVKVAPVRASPAQTPGQWRRFAREMASVFTALRPWAERLGYPGN
jgi:hypothetical protein